MTHQATKWNISEGNDGYYIIFYYSVDDFECFGPFPSREEAEAELDYILSK